MVLSDAQKKAQKKYKAKMKKVQIELHEEKDKDIIKVLETKKSKQGYIKELIRKNNENK